MGLLRVLRGQTDMARIGFMPDGSFYPFVEGFNGDIAAVVYQDVVRSKGKQGWSLEYEKEEKNGMKRVADLKAPPSIFASFLSDCVEQWLRGSNEPVAYAAAFGTSVAVDGKGNTKPTAFHFTAANQQFLGAVETIRSTINSEWVTRSLFEGRAGRPGSNLRWDPSAERNWALMASNPTMDGTSVDAPVEWLAFRGLPLFPSFPRGMRIVTTSVRGRGDDMEMTWPLWSVPISLETTRSVLQIPWTDASRIRLMRGVFAVCTSAIRRTIRGFGNFGPANVIS